MTIDSLQYKQLRERLDVAEKLVGEFKGGYSDHFFSAEDFNSELKESIRRLKNGNLNDSVYLVCTFL
jgi:hypothetical protein